MSGSHLRFTNPGLPPAIPREHLAADLEYSRAVTERVDLHRTGLAAAEVNDVVPCH